MRVTYTLEIPSAIYRLIPGTGRVELLFKDRNRIITYPVGHPRYTPLVKRLVNDGKVHYTHPRSR